LGVNLATEERVAAAINKLNPQDVPGIERIYPKAFPIVINPYMLAAMQQASKITPPEEKYAHLKQFADAGGKGTVRVGTNGHLVYVSQTVKDKATKSQFGSGGTMGKTAMGGV
jgi:hypothetical protein